MAKYFKHLIKVVLPFYLFTILLFSCQEGGDAGELFGQWRLEDDDNQSAELNATRYISFSGTLTLFRFVKRGQVYGSFQHTGDSLFIQCYSINGEAKDTTMVENTFGMKPFDNIRMKIVTLDDDQLVLNKGSEYWRFYKY